MRKGTLIISCSVLLLLAMPGCYRIKGSKGGGQINTVSARAVNAGDIALHPGYKIESVASGLNFPTAVAFDNSSQLYVIEAGYSYGEVWNEPRLLRVDTDGKTKVITSGDKNGPWTGITWHDGAFYIAEGGVMNGGRILKVSKEGVITSLISDLPTVGDHHTNGPVIKDGYIYFGLGTATNSGVVGKDNADFGWLKRKREFHDIPCQDVTLTGKNYNSPAVFEDNSKAAVTTGAYVPFGTSTTPGQVIKGSLPCSGAVLRILVNGGKPELVAWGFRNPFGLSFSPDGRLFITENGYDERGSRPVWGAGDVLWEVKQGTWYGWPDYSAGKRITDDEEFKSPSSSRVKPVLQKYPGVPPKPAAVFGVHSSANGFDFSRNADFGYQGEAFVAQFGDMAPDVGKVMFPVGFKVVRVNADNGVIRDFAVNKGKRNGPASRLRSGGLERPVAVKFDPSGKVLYVVDFGIMRMTKKGPEPQQNTGMIWKITKR
jgi:glucose/arabinose dehydrogenase